MTFGEKLIRLRKIKGITQDEFAAIIGVSRQAVYKWESEKSYPEVSKLLEIKNLFNISIDNLLDEGFEIEMPKKKRKKRLSSEKKRQIESEIEKELLYSTVNEGAAGAALQTSEHFVQESVSTTEETPKEESTQLDVVQKTENEVKKEKRVGLFGRLFGRK